MRSTSTLDRGRRCYVPTYGKTLISPPAPLSIRCTILVTYLILGLFTSITTRVGLS